MFSTLVVVTLITISFGETLNPRFDCPTFIGYDNINDSPNPQVNGIKVPLQDAQNDDGAACLDGSVPVMYWRPGAADGVNKFHVFFEGGGWCGGINTVYSPCQDTCTHRAGTTLGSSNTYPEYANYDSGYMSTSPSVNPLSYNWNTIYVKYCDGGSFSGNNMTVDTSGSVKLHWRGWKTLNGVFKLLINKYNFNSATDVLMSGCSAGGLTTWLHSDYVYDTYVKPLGATFLSMPDSGFFREYEGQGKYITAMQWIWEYMNVSDALNVECMSSKSADDKYKCLFAQETAPFVHVRMFPIQSRFDSWQANCELRSSNASAINEYGTNLTNDFESMYINSAKYGANHGGFLDSCYHHCGYWDAIKIDGYNSGQAQFEFYYANETHNKFWFQNDQYPCSTCC